MFGISTQELLIVMGILILLFGASRLPSLMRNMGRSVNEFKQGLKDKPADDVPTIESGDQQDDISKQEEITS